MSNTPISEAIDISSVQLEAQDSTPDTPSGGYGRVFLGSDNNLYLVKDTGVVIQLGEVGAPDDARYVLLDANGDLPNAQDLSQLTSGKILKVTVSGGIATIEAAVAGTDYVSLTGLETLTNKTLTTPAIGDFTSAQHDHLDADDGGKLSASAIDSGTFDWARLPVSGANVYASADQSIPNNSEAILLFNSEKYDTDAYHSTVSNTSRLTIPATGYYTITGHVIFPSNATGFRYAAIKLNGSIYLASQGIPALSATAFATVVPRTRLFTAGDYIELAVYQNSGGSLSVIASGATDEHGSYFTITRH